MVVFLQPAVEKKDTIFGMARKLFGPSYFLTALVTLSKINLHTWLCLKSSQTVGILHYVQINIIKIIQGFLNICPDLDYRAKDHARYSTSVMIWIPVESWLRYATQAARRKVIDVHHCFYNELAYTMTGICKFCLKMLWNPFFIQIH